MLEQVILKHQGIKELKISFILDLYAGDGEDRDYVLGFYALAVAIFVEIVGQKLLDLGPAALFFIPVDLLRHHINSIPNDNAFQTVEKHGLFHGRIAHECNGIGIAGQSLQCGKAQRRAGLHV